MKKLFILVFILLTSTVFAQEDGSETFNALRDAIRPSIPEGFSVNTERTSDSRFSYTITYDENGSEQNSLIFKLIPGSKGFSEMDIAMGGEPSSWKGRKVLFDDGSETGMSGMDMILENNAGKFSILNRDFKSFKPMSKEDLEQILAKISFDKLEK